MFGKVKHGLGRVAAAAKQGVQKVGNKASQLKAQTDAGFAKAKAKANEMGNNAARNARGMGSAIANSNEVLQPGATGVDALTSGTKDAGRAGKAAVQKGQQLVASVGQGIQNFTQAVKTGSAQAIAQGQASAAMAQQEAIHAAPQTMVGGRRRRKRRKSRRKSRKKRRKSRKTKRRRKSKRRRRR
jgi:hypothetical protein